MTDARRYLAAPAARAAKAACRPALQRWSVRRHGRDRPAPRRQPRSDPPQGAAAARLDRRRQHHRQPERGRPHGELGRLHRSPCKRSSSRSCSCSAAIATASRCRATCSAPRRWASPTSCCSPATTRASATIRTPSRSSTSTRSSWSGRRAPCASSAKLLSGRELQAGTRVVHRRGRKSVRAAAALARGAPGQEDRRRGAVRADAVHLSTSRIFRQWMQQVRDLGLRPALLDPGRRRARTLAPRAGVHAPARCPACTSPMRSCVACAACRATGGCRRSARLCP